MVEHGRASVAQKAEAEARGAVNSARALRDDHALLMMKEHPGHRRRRGPSSARGYADADRAEIVAALSNCCSGATSCCSEANHSAANGTAPRVLRAGAPELRLDVDGLNAYAAMRATMKEMGFDEDAQGEAWAEEGEEGEEEAEDADKMEEGDGEGGEDRGGQGGGGGGAPASVRDAVSERASSEKGSTDRHDGEAQLIAAARGNFGQGGAEGPLAAPPAAAPASTEPPAGASARNSPSNSPRADVAAVAINVDDDACAAPARSPAAEHPCQGHAVDPASGASTRSADEISRDLPTRSPDETKSAASSSPDDHHACDCAPSAPALNAPVTRGDERAVTRGDEVARTRGGAVYGRASEGTRAAAALAIGALLVGCTTAAVLLLVMR